LRAPRTGIIFTGSGTEADNQALLGVTRTLSRPAHVIASAIEHHAVMGALDRLHSEGIETTLVPVDAEGSVHPAAFENALRPHTVLASVMYVNNEIGTVQPVAELARIARARGVLLHVDAVAAPSWLPVEVDDLGADLLSLSAHKLGGPKGIGVLFAREGLSLAPILYGGGQESGRRSGTENVLGAVGFAVALELATAERVHKSSRVGALRDRLESGIRSAVTEVRFNGAGSSRSANISNVSFAGVDSAALLIGLDLAGIAVSAGSACTSGALEPSHVLAALGLEERWRRGAIRFSLGTETRLSEIERTIGVLAGLVTSLRAPAPAA
jgi:cysteine desulfurase